ncbi:MAG: hypothetical protein M1812_007193 [Candelaria pacifica]|nr:MAG: hypothetical protein M1812_007193 [Candelaria pacifica]
MADRRSNDLHYGHFGEPLYDANDKQWRFNRKICERTILRPLGLSRTSVPATSIGASAGQHQPHGLLKRQAQLLAKSHPEIDPAVSLLPSLATISGAVSSLTSEYDPIISERFALGRALDAANGISSSKTVPIAAMAAGTNGDALKLVKIREDWFGWGGDRSVNLIVPEIEGGIEGWWTGDGGVIQQTSFAEKAGAGTTWLAVRLPSATVILRPLLRSVSVPASSLEFGHYLKEYPSSPLDANPVLALPVHRTGGIPHVDVTFNPWFERQFAIVDQEGSWSVWTIEDYRLRTRSAYAGAGKSGHVLKGASDELKATLPRQADGWGKLCWVGDGNTLLVCNRRRLAIFDLKAPKPASLRAPNVGLERSSDWILDLKRSPADDNHVFVLTSSLILWLEITAVGEDDDIMSGGRTLLSLRHSRQGDDISLGLQLLPMTEEEMLVLVFSHLNGIVNAFQLSLPVEPPSIPILFSDPCLLDLPREILCPLSGSRPATSGKDLAISALVLNPLDMKVNARYDLGGVGTLYWDHDTRFFRLLVQLNDLSLRNCLYTSGAPSSGWQRESDRFEDVVAPTLQLKDAVRAGQSATRVKRDDFVVEDGIQEMLEPDGRSLERLPPHRKRNARLQSASIDQRDDPWTVDSQLLYDLASGAEIDKPNIIGGLELPEQQKFSHYLETLKTRLERKAETSFSPVQSLLELTSTRPQVEDLSEESLYLEESLQTVLNEIHPDETGSTLITTNLVSSSFFGPPHQDENGEPVRDSISLSNIYTKLLKDWVTPLSDEVPGRTRIAKAKIAAQVAAELSLASVGVKLRPAIDPPPVSQAELASPPLSTFNLPVRPRPGSPTTSSSSKGKQRQTLPYPTPQPSSLDPPVSTNSGESGTAFVEDPASARLRAYTSLTPQPQLPSSLSNILSRWVPGTDPATYNWSASHVTPSEPIFEEGKIEARERSKQRKKQERLLKRQRSDTLTTSQPEEPVRIYGSQPTLVIRSLMSSQPTEEEGNQIPKSQAERGRHGGRPVLGMGSRPLAKKPRRPPGF